MPKEMTHNDFDFYQDLIKPLHQFLTQQISMTTAPLARLPKVVFSENLYLPPRILSASIPCSFLMKQKKEWTEGPVSAKAILVRE
jgi:hypothetical protein